LIADDGDARQVKVIKTVVIKVFNFSYYYVVINEKKLLFVRFPA